MMRPSATVDIPSATGLAWKIRANRASDSVSATSARRRASSRSWRATASASTLATDCRKARSSVVYTRRRPE